MSQTKEHENSRVPTKLLRQELYTTIKGNSVDRTSKVLLSKRESHEIDTREKLTSSFQ